MSARRGRETVTKVKELEPHDPGTNSTVFQLEMDCGHRFRWIAVGGVPMVGDYMDCLVCLTPSRPWNEP